MIYYSGLESKKNKQIAKEEQVPVVIPFNMQYKGMFRDFKHIILSPGFTYYNDRPDNNKRNGKTAYWKRYVKFIADNHEKLDGYFELDTDPETVAECREAFFEKGLDPILVIHNPDLQVQKKTLELALSRAPEEYTLRLAIHGDFKPEWIKNWFTKHIPKLRENKILVHGINFNILKEYNEIPFYSISQSYWQVGPIYGSTFLYKPDDKRLKSFDSQQKDKCRSQFLSAAKKQGIDGDAFLNDDDYAVTKWNISQWKQLRRDPFLAYWRHKNDSSTAIIRHKLKELARFGGSSPAMQMMRLCDNCRLADQCPYMMEGATCTIVSQELLETPKNLQDAAINIASNQYKRIELGLWEENLEGLFLSDKVTNAQKDFLEMLEKIKALGADNSTIEVKATGKGIGALSAIFSGLGGTSGGTRKEPASASKVLNAANNIEDEPIDAEFEEIDDD